MLSSSLLIQFLLCTLLLDAAAAALLHASVRHNGSAHRNFLRAHNAVRSRHPGIDPLSWNATVAAYARDYAGRRVGDCQLKHSGGPYGENLFWGSSSSRAGRSWIASDAVSAWASEEKFYDGDSNECAGGECGHYTQVVWSKTKVLGCARVTCDDGGGVFITCNYFPPGNVVGERPY